jgi:hypothetical protein
MGRCRARNPARQADRAAAPLIAARASPPDVVTESNWKHRGTMKRFGTRSNATVIGRARSIAQRFVLGACLLSACASAAVAAGLSSDDPVYPDRRREQFPKEYGYAAFPYPYRLPGIGSGIGLVGGALNIADSYTDVYGIAFMGDVKGAAFGVGDLHLVPRNLIVDIGYSNVSKATVQSYGQRGMNTDKNDYRLIEIGDSEYYGGRMTGTFFDRRFEMYGAWYAGASKLKSIRDKDGNVIVEAQDPPRERGQTTLLGTRLDLTDDYTDPRRGIRLDVTRTQTPPRGSGPDFYVMDYNASAYVPFGRRNTLAFNVLRSDAFVIRQGETDPARLQLETGLDCGAITDPAQKKFCDQVIANTIANNSYGTATSLGGFNRLRSYPQGRYTGSHTQFFGTEFRWNLTDEKTPFDIFVMKGVRTSIQLALFYETGVTSDARSDLMERKNYRDTYGVGLRIVTASGVVLRGDVGFGKEGFNTAIFIGYPWEL